MKVLHINSHIGTDGVSQYLRNVSMALVKDDHEVVIALDSRRVSETGSIAHIAKVTYIPDLAVTPWFTGKQRAKTLVLNLIEMENPDIVIIHMCANDAVVGAISQVRPTLLFLHINALSCIAATRLLKWPKYKMCTRRAGLRCIPNFYLRRCGSIRGLAPARAYINWRQTKRTLNRVTKIIVGSQFLRRDLLEETVIEDERIAVIPPLVHKYRDREKLAEHGNSESMVLYVGRITLYKGLSYLILSLPYIKTPFKLVVAGDGYHLGKVKKLCRKLKIEKKVEFLGSQSQANLHKLYGKCSLLVVPSVWPEPFGMVGVEAMAHSRPVVAFDVGGISEWLYNGENGILVKPMDVHGLAKSMDLLLKRKSLARQMGKRGKEIFEEKFSSRRHLRLLMAICKEAKRVFGSRELASVNNQ